jgi:hypothetical protein
LIGTPVPARTAGAGRPGSPRRFFVARTNGRSTPA